MVEQGLGEMTKKKHIKSYKRQEEDMEGHERRRPDKTWHIKEEELLATKNSYENLNHENPNLLPLRVKMNLLEKKVLV